MKFEFFKRIKDIVFDFYYYNGMPETLKIDLVSNQIATIRPKQMFKIRLDNPELEYYFIDKYNLNKEIVDKNWVTSRGIYLDKYNFDAFLFNEGEYDYNITVGMNVGTAELKKISFNEWKQKWIK